MDGPHETPEFIDEGVPFLSVDNIVDNGIDFAKTRFISSQAHSGFSVKCKPQRDDVLLTKAASVGRVAVVNTDRDFNVWSPIAVLRANQDVLLARFLSYSLMSHQVQAQIDLACTSNTQRNLAMGDIGSLQIPLKPVDEQRRIADYLDAETARIDALIAARNFQTNLLIERLTSNITGIFSRFRHDEWPLKYLANKIGSGKTPTGGADVYQDDGVLFLRSQNVHRGELRLADAAYISRDIDSQMSSTRVKPGDVLLNITGASIGRCAHVTSDLPSANVNQHVCIIRPNPGIDGELVSAALLTPFVQEQIRVLQVGGNREGLNFEQVGNLVVKIPAQEADRETALELIRRATSDSTLLIALLAASVSRLVERRRALITAAVTGQFEIPGAAA